VAQYLFPMKTRKLASLVLAAAAAAASNNSDVIAGPEQDLARQLNKAFIEAAEKVSPAVVVISVTEKAGATSADWFDDENDSPSRKGSPRKTDKTFGEGSGVILSNDGYILTNNHVVEDAEKIEVKLRDGRVFPAEVRGRDSASDLAVLKISARDLPVAKLADSSKVRVGEFAIAIGAPFNLDYSVTFGHVSAKSRSNIVPDWEDGGGMDQDFIQTDANINPGNSGGPLLNIDGEVIGINTLIRGLHTGIGFAIPSNLAREISDKLIAHGRIARPWLGIRIHSVSDDPDFRELFPKVQNGVIVQSVSPGGPAAKSDLCAADVITAIDTLPINTTQQLRDEIRRRATGQFVTLEVSRGGKSLQIKIKPEEELDAITVADPALTAGNTPVPDLGLTVHSITRQLADRFGVNATDGVIIVAVEKNGLAASNEIKAGDIITAVNQQLVNSPKQFHDALKKADLKKGVLLNLTGHDESWFEILRGENP
jgi:serine protease Do